MRIGKFLFWPLFIAGVECCGADEEESAGRRDLVTKALGGIAYHLGDLSPIDVVSFLRSVWRMESDRLRTWDEKVSCVKENSVFFL